MILGKGMMKQISLLLAALTVWGWACRNQADRGQPGEATFVGSAQQPEGGVSESIQVPSEAASDTLLQLQRQIMQQPENAALRRELGHRAIDEQSGVIWAVGIGKVNPQASSPSVAQSQAEQAALADASRWAAYLIEWRKTDYATNFGTLQGNVPGVQLVRKAVTDSLCIVLAQVPWRQE
jgi:hypothetical protein